MQYISEKSSKQAPSWCDAFIENYCKQKSGEPTMNDHDQTLCACLLKKTVSDECLWPDCRLAPDGQTWKTAQQYANTSDPNYCSNQCKTIESAVEHNTASINVTQYNEVCGNVPLPPSSGGGGGSGGDDGSGGGGGSGSGGSGGGGSGGNNSSGDGSGGSNSGDSSGGDNSDSSHQSKLAKWFKSLPVWAYAVIGGVVLLFIVVILWQTFSK